MGTVPISHGIVAKTFTGPKRRPSAIFAMWSNPLEADWEFDLMAGSPVMDGCWPGMIDLTLEPQRVAELEETRGFPPLGPALVLLNGPESAFLTAKSDVWTRLDQDDFDPDEMAADREINALWPEISCICCDFEHT